MRLRAVRSSLRHAIMEVDVLGLTTASPVVVHSGGVRQDVWRHVVENALRRQLQGAWATPYILRAWRKGEADADGLPGSLSSGHLETLLGHELDGIVAAIVAALARLGVRHFTSKAAAWAAIAAVFDAEVNKRVPALVSTMTVQSYNRGKVETYRTRGVERVGILPEERPERLPPELSTGTRAELAAGAVIAAHALFPGERTGWIKNEETGEWEFKRPKRAERALRRAFPEEGQQVGVQTAEDDRVCDSCDAIAADSPYGLDQAMDLLPAHIGCRCSIVEWTEDDEEDVADAEPPHIRDAAVQPVYDYSPDEPRDPYGKWTVGGGGLGLPREEDDPTKKKDWAKNVRKTLHQQIELALTVGGGALGTSLGGIIGGIIGSTVGAIGGKQVTKLLSILERRDYTHQQAVHAVAKELGVALDAALTDAQLEDRYQAVRVVLMDAKAVFDAFDAFNPDQPRDPHGQWTSGGGATSADVGVKASGIEAADKIKAEWAAATPVDSLDKLMQHGPGDQHSLVAAATEIQQHTGAAFINPGVKTRARTQQKIDSGRAPSTITDVVRGGFKVETPQQADAVVAGLAKRFTVADEGWAKTPAGYFDRKLMLKFASGIVGEVQLWHPEMLAAKEHGGGHTLYVEWSKANRAGDRQQAEALNTQMHALYKGVTDHLPAAWSGIVGK